MFKKPVISKEAEVLLKLLRIALGNETDYTLPENVDWREVVRLSYEHKVSALAVDGLSLNYPRPIYRGTGDIDVFLVDKDGRPAAEEEDRIGSWRQDNGRWCCGLE